MTWIRTWFIDHLNLDYKMRNMISSFTCSKSSWSIKSCLSNFTSIILKCLHLVVPAVIYSRWRTLDLFTKMQLLVFLATIFLLFFLLLVIYWPLLAGLISGDADTIPQLKVLQLFNADHSLPAGVYIEDLESDKWKCFQGPCIY